MIWVLRLHTAHNTKLAGRGPDPSAFACPDETKYQMGNSFLRHSWCKIVSSSWINELLFLASLPLQVLASRAPPGRVSCLVLSPTRELARQIGVETHKMLTFHSNLKSHVSWCHLYFSKLQYLVAAFRAMCMGSIYLLRCGASVPAGPDCPRCAGYPGQCMG